MTTIGSVFNSGGLSRINIRPEVTILSILQHLNYRPWFALAEFVDNSLQSFLSNEKEIQVAENQKTKLRIEIELTPDQKIIIRDNAAGIREMDFPRAFRPAEIPLDRSGLSEFGMGMKSAACWFSRQWSVRTKALGEDVERTIYFDIAKIVSQKTDELTITTRSAKKNEHYTEIVLWDLLHPPKGRTIQKIKDHLASIYRVYLRNNFLELVFLPDLLIADEPKIMISNYWKNPGTEPVLWKKKIDMDFGESQRVTGFAALRETASTSLAGFALFRRDRLIEGSADDTYRPLKIFGNSNSYTYQRLFGELHFEGFEVSHTKDGFRWEEYEDLFLDCLKEELKKEPLNILSQAEGHRVNPHKKSIEAKAILATENVASEIESDVPEVLESEEKNPSKPGPIPPTLPKSELQASSRSVSIDDGGQVWEILIRTTIDPGIGQWLRLGEFESRKFENGKRTRAVTIDVSLAHPFVQKYLGASNENLEVFISFAAAISLSLILTSHAIGSSPSIPLHHLNTILRNALGK